MAELSPFHRRILLALTEKSVTANVLQDILNAQDDLPKVSATDLGNSLGFLQNSGSGNNPVVPLVTHTDNTREYFVSAAGRHAILSDQAKQKKDEVDQKVKELTITNYETTKKNLRNTKIVAWTGVGIAGLNFLERIAEWIWKK